MQGFYIRANFAVITRLDGTITRRARPGRPKSRTQSTWPTLLPEVTLHVHCYAGPEPTGVVRVEGVGSISEEWLRRLLGEPARFRVQPVLDIEGQAPVDGYEIPDRHRKAVHLMTPADTFPFASSTARDKQIDHTEPYQHGPGGPSGQSRLGNYGPMTTFHHRVKTFGKWTVTRLARAS